MFKKILFGLTVATSLVACDGDYKDWAEPQQNAQPATVSFGNGSVSEVGLIDFATLAEEAENVKVCDVKAPTASDATYDKTVYTITLNGKEEMTLTEDGSVNKEGLKTYVETNYGKAPEVRNIKATVQQWIANGKTSVKTAQSGEFNINVKLQAPEIYPHMYVIGAFSEWDPSCTTLPMAHSEQSVYDDPVFTITLPVAEGDTWFAFADDKTVETGEWSNVFGCREGNGNNLVGELGSFTRRSDLEDDGSFKISVNGDAKFVKITLNVLDGTYLIEKVNFVDYIYLPGNAQGWNPETAPALKHMGDGLYTGMAYMDGDFKFTQERKWAAEYNNSSFDTASPEFNLYDHTGGNIGCSKAGVYYFEVNVVTRDLKATFVEKVGLIGDFNGWGSDFEMTWDAANLCYVAENPGITAAGWKFRINGGWDINFGGALDNLELNGGNIDVVGNVVKFYPCRTTTNNIYCTVE